MTQGLLAVRKEGKGKVRLFTMRRIDMQQIKKAEKQIEIAPESEKKKNEGAHYDYWGKR